MLIEVIENDIEYGEPGRPCLCPVARAFKRYGYDVSVPGDAIRFFPKDDPYNDSVLVSVPEFVWRAIRAFDSYRVMEPFSFEIDIPEGVPCNKDNV